MVGTQSTIATLLGTALVLVQDSSGALQLVRALIDSASQISAVTSNCLHRLGLCCARWTTPITGLTGQRVPEVKCMATCQVQARINRQSEVVVKTWVLPSITGVLPSSPLPQEVRSRCDHLKLADPEFDVPGPIELLLGADVFPQVWGIKSVSLGHGFPSAFTFHTIFGWVLIGTVDQVADWCSRFSSYVRMLRVVAWIRRFTNRNVKCEMELCIPWLG